MRLIKTRCAEFFFPPGRGFHELVRGLRGGARTKKSTACCWGYHLSLFFLWCILGFSTKPLKVKLLAGEQKETKFFPEARWKCRWASSRGAAPVRTSSASWARAGPWRRGFFGDSLRWGTPCCHLLKNMFFYIPLLVLKGFCHYWTYVFDFFSQVLSKWKLARGRWCVSATNPRESSRKIG